MKYLTLSFILALMLFAFSCAEKQSESVADEAAIDYTAISNDPPKNPQEMPHLDLYSNGKTKLIKTLNYRFEVENVNKSTEAIEAAVKKYPAYISASKLKLENPILENTITIRIQSEYFQDILKEIDQQAKFVNFRDVTTNDVAKEFVDLESRLKTKREVEARYTEILRKHAGTVEELFNAEQKIGELHEEIEATISRINYLKEQVSYSTLNLEFYQTVSQEVAAIHKESQKAQFTEALKAGWNGVVSVVLIFTYLWPLVIIGASIGFYAWYQRKKKMLNAVQS